ncbi:MAG: hypothetical protein RIB84_09725 [Sneathiellaceae bacterium]
MTDRAIDRSAATRRALQALCAADADLARIRPAVGLLPRRRRDPGFRSLAAIMVQQQVSLASAAAIWARLEAHLGRVEPSRLLGESDAALLGCGLSRPKLRYLRAAAMAVSAGDLDLEGLAALPEAQAREAMVQVTGIGRWTADIYLSTALGHPDIWPAHDLALQVALQDAKGLAGRPLPRDTDLIALAWAPHRSTAARLLWAHYRVIKGRDAV